MGVLRVIWDAIMILWVGIMVGSFSGILAICIGLGLAVIVQGIRNVNRGDE